MCMNHSCSHWTRLPGCAGHINRGPRVVTGSFLSILHGVLSSDLHAAVPVLLNGPGCILLGAPAQRLLCVTACWSWPNLADVHPSVSSAASQQADLHGSRTRQDTRSPLMRKCFGACAMRDARGCVLSCSFGPRRPLASTSSSLLVRSATIRYCPWEERSTPASSQYGHWNE